MIVGAIAVVVRQNRSFLKLKIKVSKKIFDFLSCVHCKLVVHKDAT